jgi:hypothetical protein
MNEFSPLYSNPSVFNFYNYLRAHPLILKQQQVLTAASAATNAPASSEGNSKVRIDKIRISMSRNHYGLD